MYSAMDVAKYCVAKCYIEKSPISNLKLQKYLFYIQLEFLNNGSKAFSDEIQAWMYGPVVPSVYYHYSVFGALDIKPNDENDINLIKNDKDIHMIDKVITEYRGYSVGDLVEKTHIKGGAWDRTYRNGAGTYNVITDDLMKECGR